MSDDFGIFAKDLRLKVTNNVKQAGKVIIIPCQMGFKQQDGSWANEWVDLVVFQGSNYDLALSVAKGATINASGRFALKEYQGKKSWQILCDHLEATVNQTKNIDNIPSGQAAPDDAPF